MHRLWIALCVVLVARIADGRVVMPPLIQRSCRAPMSWTELAACVRPYAMTPLPPQPTSTVALVRDRTRAYMFLQRGDGKWQLNASLRAGDYDVIGRRKVKAGSTVLDRVDLFGHESDRTTMVHRKLALFCSQGSCNELVYACTALSRGRAIETFVGDVKIAANELTVIGDRSQSGTLCP